MSGNRSGSESAAAAIPPDHGDPRRVFLLGQRQRERPSEGRQGVRAHFGAGWYLELPLGV
jgi:hypothetical protein